MSRIRDPWGNEYRILNHAKVDALQWKGRPIDVYEPEPTVRPGMSAYGGETIASVMPFDKLRSILGEPPSMQPVKDLASGTSPKLRLRLPMTPRIAPFEQNLRGSHDSNTILMPRIEPEERRPPR